MEKFRIETEVMIAGLLNKIFFKRERERHPVKEVLAAPHVFQKHCDAGQIEY